MRPESLNETFLHRVYLNIKQTIKESKKKRNMSTSKPSVIDTTVQKSMKMINEVSDEAHIDDPHAAFQGLRATLQTLRDRLPAGEAAQLGAQLPRLICGFYYEGWKPAAEPRKDRTKEEFLDHIRSYMQDTEPNIDAELTARSVFNVVGKSVSQGEIDDIKNAMPEELRDLWQQSDVAAR